MQGLRQRFEDLLGPVAGQQLGAGFAHRNPAGRLLGLPPGEQARQQALGRQHQPGAAQQPLGRRRQAGGRTGIGADHIDAVHGPSLHWRHVAQAPGQPAGA